MRSETNQMERDQMSKYGHIVLSDEQPEPNIDQLAEDIKLLVTATIKASRWALVEGYWSVGQQIRMEIPAEYQKGNKSCLSDLTRKSGIGERTLYRCIQVYEQYPDINTLPEGENISWNKLITKYLSGNDEAKKLKDTFEKPGLWFDEIFTRAKASKSGRVTFERDGEKWTLSKVVEKKGSENGAVINGLITLFEPVNPSFEQLFKRPSERAATERLLLKHGEDNVRKMIMALPVVLKNRYMPRITTPTKLEDKLGELLLAMKGEKNGQNIDLRTL